jgi:hypothetical protein
MIEFRIEMRGRMVIGTYQGRSIGVRLERSRNSSIHNREIKLAKQRIAAQLAGQPTQMDRLLAAFYG